MPFGVDVPGIPGSSSSSNHMVDVSGQNRDCRSHEVDAVAKMDVHVGFDQPVLAPPGSSFKRRDLPYGQERNLVSGPSGPDPMCARVPVGLPERGVGPP
eukprot:15465353-Alexandrium_andersonii.AAC.1